jgi:hypothetical protein
MMDQRDLKTAGIFFLAGLILGFLLLPKPETEEVYKFTTKTKTDTLFVDKVSTVYIPKTSIKTEVIRDTIIIDYKPQISLFETSFPFEHGSTKVSGEVLGEVLKMTATNDYKIPVVTNTITNTETKTIIQKPKGIYLGAGISSLLEPSAKISYLDNKYLFQYQYQPFEGVHQIGVSKKLF